MKNFFILMMLLLTGRIFLQAQAPNLQKAGSFGGSENEFAYEIHQTTDRGYIVAGQTASNDGNVSGNHGDEDFWILKLNSNGSIKWQKALGGFGDESAFSIQQTTDGGYIAAGQAGFSSGQVTGNHGILDVWVVKLDANGNLTWQKSYGGSNRDFANSIRQTADGGYIVAGGSFSNDGDVTGHHGYNIYADYWILKLDGNGNIQWRKTYGGSKGDIAISVRQTNEGGYIVAGNSASMDGDVQNVHDSVYGDFWILKLNAQGNIQWQKAFGGSDYEQANSIEQTTDGGYVAMGWNRSPNNGNVTGNHGNYDFWVVKMNAIGNMQWQKSLGGSEGDIGYGIKQTADNGYVVAGGTSSNNGDVSGNHGKEDFWLAKISSTGNLTWQKTMGGTEYEQAHTIDLTNDGGYIMAGFSGFINVNNGDVRGNHGNYDFWITKLTSGASFTGTVNIADNKQAVDKSFINDLEVSPNPATSFLSIKITGSYETASLQIAGSNGKIMLEKTLRQEDHQQQLDIKTFTKGTYLVTIKTGNNIITKKFIKQ